MKKNTLTILCVTTLVFTVLGIYAGLNNVQSAAEKELYGIKLDGRFVEYFNRSVFGTEIPRSYLNNYTSVYSDKSFYSKENLKENYPWLYRNIYFKEKPDFAVINKWQKDIKVSVGLPLQGKPFKKQKEGVSKLSVQASESFNIPGLIDNQNYNEYLEADLNIFISQLSEITNLDIEYIPSGQETIKNYANLRIVFIDKHLKETIFKDPFSGGVSISSSFSRPVFFYGGVHNEFPYMVELAENGNKNIEGYILPNSKNQIDMAFCYIFQNHDEITFKNLVRECVYRSLGIPRISKIENFAKGAFDKPNHTKIIELNEYDKAFLEMLYNPKIKSGMRPDQVEKIIKTF